jgi:hypothetical protein
MKNRILFTLMLCFVLTKVTGQESKINLGAGLGITSGAAIGGVAISLESNYLFNISDKFKLGPSILLLHYFGGLDNFIEETNNTSTYLPTALALRYSLTQKSMIGFDFGYAVGISSTEGASYFRPMYGYTINDKLMLQLTYSAMGQENGDLVSNLSVGIMFKI